MHRFPVLYTASDISSINESKESSPYTDFTTSNRVVNDFIDETKHIYVPDLCDSEFKLQPREAQLFIDVYNRHHIDYVTREPIPWMEPAIQFKKSVLDYFKLHPRAQLCYQEEPEAVVK